VRLKNKLSEMNGRSESRDYGKGGVQYVSKGTLAHWLKAAGLKMEKLEWIATPKFEKAVRLSGGIFGPMFAAEMIALAGKKR